MKKLLFLILSLVLGANAQVVAHSCSAPAGGGTSTSYSFPEANGANLDVTYWTPIEGGASNIKVNATHQAYSSASGANSSRYIGSDVTWTANQWGSVTRATYTSGTYGWGVMLRAQTDNTSNYYRARCLNGGTCDIYKVVNGTPTQVGGVWTYTVQNGDVLKWTVTGTGASTNFDFYVNGVHQTGTQTDAAGTYSTGTPGLYLYGASSTSSISNWSAGNQ